MAPPLPPPRRRSKLALAVWLCPVLALGACWGARALGEPKLAVHLGTVLGLLGVILYVVAYIRMADSPDGVRGLPGLLVAKAIDDAPADHKRAGAAAGVAGLGLAAVGVVLALLAVLGVIGVIVWALITNPGHLLVR